MVILRGETVAVDFEHREFWREALPQLLRSGSGRVLVIGRQTMDKRLTDPGCPTVASVFERHGWQPTQLDLHDPAAEWRADLNAPLLHPHQYDLVLDIGTLEHIANSHQAFESYLDLVNPGGYLFLLTPVKGYFDHGFHTFSPEYVLETLKQNSFSVTRIWWLNMLGPHILGTESIPKDWHDVCIVVLAKNTGFKSPMKAVQQRRWVRA